MDFPLPPPPHEPDPNDKFGWELAQKIMTKDFYWICRPMYEKYFRGRPGGEEGWINFFRLYDWSGLLKDKKKKK